MGLLGFLTATLVKHGVGSLFRRAERKRHKRARQREARYDMQAQYDVYTARGLSDAVQAEKTTHKTDIHKADSKQLIKSSQDNVKMGDQNPARRRLFSGSFNEEFGAAARSGGGRTNQPRRFSLKDRYHMQRS